MLPGTCINSILKYGISYKSHVIFKRNLVRRLLNLENGFTLSFISSMELYSQISTMPCLYAKALHTTKRWKYMARDGEKPNKLSDDLPLTCEDGNEAVPHSVVISKLQNCNSVGSQIKTFSSIVSLTPLDMERRNAFCQSFHEAFKIYFPHFKTFQFGSGVNGLGFRGCDTDVCLQTNFNNEDYLLQKDVPTLQSVLDGTVSRETISRLTPLYMLRFVRRIVRKHCPDIKEPILLIKARCPILRFYDAKYNLFCDFSCASKFPMQNTRLLRLICNLDKRFSDITKVIRYWGKYGGFVGDIEMFNSYAFSLLVVHFLQCTNPPVLPSIQEMLSKSEYLQNGNVDDIDQLLKDLEHFSPSKNTITSEELLKEFFFYYVNYDFSRIMQPYTSSSMPVSSFVPEKDLEDTFEYGTVNIQDPFRHSFNSTSGASFKSCKRFLNGLMQACEVYQDKSLWLPQARVWGLSYLFHTPISEKTLHMKWQQNRSHTIKVPALPDAAKKIRRIFEYGLLFHCTEYRLKQNTDHAADSKPVIKIHCKAKSRTWQGRNSVNLKHEENCNVLDLENLISMELSKVENQRHVLLEFHCECNEVVENNEAMLILIITFKENFPPNVAIFLKEYIPCILKKL